MPPEVSPTPEEARATRRKKLFARWSDGKRLDKSELEEIADLIAQAKGEAPGLQLEGEPAAKPGTYLRTYQWYAENLPFEKETSVESRIRLIKRWVHAGRNHSPAADYPPFDDPPRIGAWLLRVMRRRLTAWDGFFTIAEPPRGQQEQVPEKNSTQQHLTGETPKPPAGESLDLSSIVELSAVDNLTAMRRVVGAAYKLYAKALLAGSSDIDQRHRAWLAASGELRKTEKDTEDLRESKGELIPRDRLTAELLRIHTAMAGTLRGELRDRRGQTIDAAVEADIVTAFFRPLRTGDFGLPETAPPPVAPPPAAPEPAAAPA